MNIIGMCGDETFDNAIYTKGAPTVEEQMKGKLTLGWDVIVAAEDGATIKLVYKQLRTLPKVVNYIVICAGLGDAVHVIDMLPKEALSIKHALDQLRPRIDEFKADYSRMLQYVKKRNVTTAVCTIYNCDFPSDQKLAAETVLNIFNSIIYEAANQHNISVIELRRVLTNPADYTCETAISTGGGRKLTTAICKHFGAIL